METLKKIAAFLNGKKTYLTAVFILLVGYLHSRGIDIPEYVWAALAAAGLGFLRMAVQEAINTSKRSLGG